MSQEKPTISLVTPCLNQQGLIEAAIASVLDQRYPHLEYVVIDGGSTDGSADAIANVSDELAYWVSEPDAGHYPALNKGFAKTSGEIMGYLNGDDLLLPGSLDLIAHIFTAFPDIEWITGAYVAIDDKGRPVDLTSPARWSRWHILNDVGSFIPQESTFWRRSLWTRSGGGLDESFPLAADFELWARFSRDAPLTTVRAPLACFRHVAGQRSIALRDRYLDEVEAIRARELAAEAETSKAARSARRLLGMARKPGIDRIRPVVDSVLGAPPELVFDAASNSFIRRRHAGRAARSVERALTKTVGKRLQT
jgi:glycosyltransferase involved in cell wall biosynthesis